MKTTERLHWWHSPYTLREKVDFLRYRISAPSTVNHSGLDIEREPMVWDSGARAEEKGVRIGFVGDFMPIGDRALELGSELQCQLAELDYVVINMEGVLTSARRYLAVAFEERILEQIRAAFPQKIIFNVANNHSADFGRKTYERHLAQLRKYGQIVGHDHAGLLLSEGIYLRSATMLSNQPISVCAWANIPEGKRISSEAPADAYSIYLPHWGYEMHLYPERGHADFAHCLLSGGWDAVIGSHPHVPQPLWLREDGTFCLFSLGNFCYENVNPNHSYGKLLTLHVSTSGSRPQLSWLRQTYTRQQLCGTHSICVDTVHGTDYPLLKSTCTKDIRYFSDLIK